MNNRLEGKVAIVTGVSKGIGSAIAKALAAQGASVIVNYSSSREAAEKVVSGIASGGGRAVAIKASVAKAQEIQQLFAEAEAHFGKLDILVNNAGIYQPTPIGTITEESFHKHFDLNVLGVLLASQEAVKRFGTEGGVIVNISSVVAQVTPPGIAVYSATKGAVDSVTRAFSRELASRKIRVNSVNPDLIATRERMPSVSWRRGKSHKSIGTGWQSGRHCLDRGLSGFGRLALDQRTEPYRNGSTALSHACQYWHASGFANTSLNTEIPHP